MINQELFNYVKQQLEQGENKEKIKSNLLGAGWQETEINEALNIPNSIKSPNFPLPPSSSSSSSFISTGTQQLDSKAVWLFFFSSFFVNLFTILVLGAGFIPMLLIADNLPINAFGIILLIFLILCIFSFIWAKLVYHFYRYELTDIGFRKESGVIFKRYVTIPYDRIQNVDIYRGIFARILGLSDLNIQTAGASGAIGAEGRLPGLSEKIAEQLRDELIKRARQNRNQGL